MNVKQMVANWLKEHGYDGLFAPGECGCELSNLMPCDESGGFSGRCEAGYRSLCPDTCGDHDFHIGPRG